jgi:hypothetical protein
MVVFFAINAVFADVPLAVQDVTPQPREVWAAQPVPETPYKAPTEWS